MTTVMALAAAAAAAAAPSRLALAVLPALLLIGEGSIGGGAKALSSLRVAKCVKYVCLCSVEQQIARE